LQLDLAGKLALVTGSSRGLGLEIARVLAAESCRVVLNGRDEKALRAAANSIDNAEILSGDVSDAAQCRRMAETLSARHRALDVLVCNVGSGRSMPPGEETPEEWQRVLTVNLLAATNAVQAFRPLLSAARGSIVCISSICGLEALGAPVTYSAAKAALNAFVRGSARPLAAAGIRINAVAPGNLLFEGSVWAERTRRDAAGVQAMLEREVALRRLGTPREIADIVAFLASSRAAFATGAVFVVDGGQVRS
jgi:3-oxoacyl-[acyl-carrier protein] reductase